MANDLPPITPQSGNSSDAFQYENEVFISYAWGGESELIVNELERAFELHGISIVRDKKDLSYKGSIDEFERRIGEGQCIILVISDRYLRSEHCMYELTEIAKNQQLHERIFPIILADASINETVDRLNYLQYWDEKIKHLNEKIKNIDVISNLDSSTAELNKYTRIREKFDYLTRLLSDMNALTPEKLAANGYITLIRAVEGAWDRNKSHKPPPEPPLENERRDKSPKKPPLPHLGAPRLWVLILVAILIIPLLFRLLTGQNIFYTRLLLSEADFSPQETVTKIFNEETGKFLVDASPMLQISSISYDFGGDASQNHYELRTKNQLTLDILPVEQASDGWKIRLEHLLDEGIIEDDQVIYVPQNINLTVHHLQPNDNPILIFVITDEIYPQQLSPRLFPYRKTLYYQGINIGQPGLLNFINLIDFSITTSSSQNIVSPGVGPIAAIVAVEFERGNPVMRSNVVFVIRKGILHPNDILFNKNLQPFISQPLDDEGHRMIAFQSPESNASTNNIMVSNLDSSRVRSIAPGIFGGSDEVICGWGDIEKNKSALYFLSSKDGGNSKIPYKVLVSNDETVGQPTRLTTIPSMCMELP